VSGKKKLNFNSDVSIVYVNIVYLILVVCIIYTTLGIKMSYQSIQSLLYVSPNVIYLIHFVCVLGQVQRGVLQPAANGLVIPFHPVDVRLGVLDRLQHAAFGRTQMVLFVFVELPQLKRVRCLEKRPTMKIMKGLEIARAVLFGSDVYYIRTGV